MNSQPHAPVVLPRGKEVAVPMEQEAGWAPEPMWTIWSREKSVVPAAVPNPERPAHILSHHFEHALPDRHSLRIVRRSANLFTQGKCRTKMLPFNVIVYAETSQIGARSNRNGMHPQCVDIPASVFRSA